MGSGPPCPPSNPAELLWSHCSRWYVTVNLITARASCQAHAGTALEWRARASQQRDLLRLIDEPVTSATANRPVRKAKRDDSAEPPKRRGRPKAEATVASSAANHPLVGIGPARLVKKVEIEKKAASPELPPVPVARIRPDRLSQAVERRPFRNVEVRALGPGRRHNRSPRRPSGSTI
jgi:hypothetical protein